jgi:uncharacterized protein (TIGR04255 family)
MISNKRYSKSPIIEAIIAIDVQPSRKLDLTELEQCAADQRQAYPRKEEVRFSPVGLPDGRIWNEQHGFAFATDDRTRIFQFSRVGFMMHELAPYRNWESFRDEAQRLWSVYRELTKPTQFVRLAVRYINRLDIPLPAAELQNYLRTLPTISSDISQGLAGFLMQLNMPQPDIGCTLVVNEVAVDSPHAGVISILLDIDLFRDTGLPENEEELWAFAEVMRDRKNQVFEACITDHMRELIR